MDVLYEDGVRFLMTKNCENRCTRLKKGLGMLTLFNIQLICSRRIWKHLVKSTVNLYKWMHNYLKWLKILWRKEKLLVLSNFSFRHNTCIFKSRLLQRRRKASIWGNGLTRKLDGEPTYNKSVTGIRLEFKYHEKSLLFKVYFWTELKTFLSKGEIAHHEQFHLLSQCFQKL